MGSVTAEPVAPPRGPVLHGPRTRRQVALTFDADMTPWMHANRHNAYDPAVVAELRETETPATIFVSGLWADAYPEVLRSLAPDPLFEIANHSFSHAAFTRNCFDLPVAESAAQKADEVTAAAARIFELAGVRTRWFRFPGGCYADGDVELVRSLGHEPVQWDVLSRDTSSGDPVRLAQDAVERARPGAIVVMHLNGAPNAPATAPLLRRLIPALRDRDLRAVTLSELLA